MELFGHSLQILVGLTLLNVWLLRFHRATPWRGGNASDMREEFEVYGLPVWFVPVVGVLKVSLAALLIAGVWFPSLTLPAAAGIAALMLGAAAMHFKVGDPARKAAPALVLLGLTLALVFLNSAEASGPGSSSGSGLLTPRASGTTDGLAVAAHGQSRSPLPVIG